MESQPEMTKAALGRRVPMGRIGEPQEFVDRVATLVLPHLKFATGLVAPVDGGSSIGQGNTCETPCSPN